MKVLIILEDTPNGIYPEIRWRDNGCCDHAADSICMHLATFLAKHIEELAKSHTLKVDKQGMQKLTDWQ
jgi:hypothetical protein